MQNQFNNHNNSNEQEITITINISKLLNMDEATKLLNIDETKLLTLLATNEIPFIEIQGKLFIDEKELWDWMHKQSPPMIKNLNPLLNIYAN